MNRSRGALVIGVVTLLAATVACSGDDDPQGEVAPTTTATTSVRFTPAAAATFTEGSCDPEPSVPERVTCGVLEVPERHASPDGPAIQVAVRIVAPEQPASGPEPVVFLAGGPGFGSVGAVEQMLTDAPATRTIVLVDYRGVGQSTPSLACPENDELELTGLAIPAGDVSYEEQSLDAMRACRDRLVADGVDIAAYNYEEIAADLESLRLALGYDRWDLWGLSNGGRVALEVVRRYPAGVRSLVLDAPSPPQGNLPGELWQRGLQAFERLFEACDEDAACAGAFPDLRGTYEGLVEQLRANPVTVTVAGQEGGPGPTPVLFSDTLALNALRQSLYETPLIPLLPFYIDELAHGRNLEAIAQLIVDRSGGVGFSDGMAQTVNCREEIAFLPEEFFAAQAEELPLAAPLLLLTDWAASCAVWDVGKADDILNEPVISDVPALILVGHFDPVHPLAAAQSIAEGLPKATVVELPALGHGTVFSGECPRTMMAAFLDAPSEQVDTSCVADLPGPEWLLPAG